MATILLPLCDTDELKRRLAERDRNRIEVPIMEWHGRQFVRVSVQGCNTPADAEKLIRALRAVLFL